MVRHGLVLYCLVWSGFISHGAVWLASAQSQSDLLGSTSGLGVHVTGHSMLDIIAV